MKALPIISPHGHTDPAWFADNEPFSNATDLLLGPDHYLYRMLYSQGVDMAALRVPGRAGEPTADAREGWRILANHFYLFRGTPSHLWLKHVFKAVFGFEDALEAETSDAYFDRITEALQTDAFRPRALFERFNIELLATTESPSEDLVHHRKLVASGWKGRVVTAYRPDPVVDPEHEQFRDALVQFANLGGLDISTWQGYLAAHRKRRADFMAMGATSTDHGHPTAATADLSPTDAAALFEKVMAGPVSPAEAELFRAQMLTEMAKMSLADGLVMQIHPGSFRNHNPSIFRTYGRDKGADIPTRTDYVRALKPLLDRFGNEKEPDHHPVHPGRDRLQPRARAPGRSLSVRSGLARPGGSTTARKA